MSVRQWRGVGGGWGGTADRVLSQYFGLWPQGNCLLQKCRNMREGVRCSCQREASVTGCWLALKPTAVCAETMASDAHWPVPTAVTRRLRRCWSGRTGLLVCFVVLRIALSDNRSGFQKGGLASLGQLRPSRVQRAALRHCHRYPPLLCLAASFSLHGHSYLCSEIPSCRTEPASPL